MELVGPFPKEVQSYVELTAALSANAKQKDEAGKLLAVVRDRPVLALTVLRHPVDRVHSRYHFLVGHKVSENRRVGWSLDKLYQDLESSTVEPFGMRPAPYRRVVSLTTLKSHGFNRQLCAQ